jgi:hypothetical protein
VTGESSYEDPRQAESGGSGGQHEVHWGQEEEQPAIDEVFAKSEVNPEPTPLAAEQPGIFRCFGRASSDERSRSGSPSDKKRTKRCVSATAPTSVSGAGKINARIRTHDVVCASD